MIKLIFTSCNFANTPKMAQDGDRWWAVVRAVMNLLVSKNVGNLLTGSEL
jgi:hypothetical protein